MIALIDKARKFGRTITLLRILVVTNNSFMLIVVGYLALAQWQRGEIAVGEIAFAMGLVLRLNLLANRFLGQANGLFRNFGQAQDSMNSVAQPVGLIDKPDAEALVIRRGQIRFRNVSFNYARVAARVVSDRNRDSDTPDKNTGEVMQAGIIDNLSLTIASGERIELVGPSDAGKPTLVNLLLRLYDLDAGVIETRRIMESGTHDERVRSGQLYASLWSR